MRSSRVRSMWRTTNSRRSRVAGSLQWRSSRTSTSGLSAARRSRRPRTSSKNRAWSAPARTAGPPSAASASGVAPTYRPNPGARVASSSPTGPSSPPRASGPIIVPRARSASRNGPYGIPSPRRSRQAPTIIRPPSASARAPNSVTSRVLPRPASPPIRTTRGSPAVARSSAAISGVIAVSRPTRIGLESVPAIARAMMGREMAAQQGPEPSRTTRVFPRDGRASPRL